MESKHTPTPWKLKDGMEIQGDSMKPIAGADGIILGFVSDKNLVDHSQRDIDAAFIVRAVNAHEDMLAALKKVERFASKASGDELLMWVQEAIAKAEGAND